MFVFVSMCSSLNLMGVGIGQIIQIKIRSCCSDEFLGLSDVKERFLIKHFRMVADQNSLKGFLTRSFGRVSALTQRLTKFNTCLTLWNASC